MKFFFKWPLWGTRGPICWPNSAFREFFCLLGAQDKTLPGNFHSLIGPWDHYSLSLFCGYQQSPSENSKGDQRVFGAAGRLLKALGGEVLFPSILPVVENDIKRNRWKQFIHIWLWEWCHWQNFVGLDHGVVCTTPGLFVPCRIHLYQWRKLTFSS